MTRQAVRNRSSRTEPQRGRARRRPSRARSRIKAFLGLLFLGAVGYAAFGGPLFRIQSIEAEVPDECRPLVEEGVPIGQNLFLFRTEALRAAVAQHPVVADVTVTRVLPDTIRVVAQPRVACARIRLPLGDFDVDRNGVIFRAAVGDDMPLLVGAEAVGALGGTVDSEAMAAIVPWLDALGRYALPRVTKVQYLGGGKCNLALSDGRLAKLGRAEDVDLKLAAAEALLAGPARDAEYVDMEVTNAGVIGERRPPEPQVADAGTPAPDAAGAAPAPAGDAGPAGVAPAPAAAGGASVS